MRGLGRIGERCRVGCRARVVGTAGYLGRRLKPTLLEGNRVTLGERGARMARVSESGVRARHAVPLLRKRNDIVLGAWPGRFVPWVTCGTGRIACATGRRARLCGGTTCLGRCGGGTIWWLVGRGLGNSLDQGGGGGRFGLTSRLVAGRSDW